MSFVGISIGTAAVGLGQAVIGGIKEHKAESALQKTPTPTYTPSKGLSDYYQEALNRYNASPFASQMYQQAQSNINRNMAQGIGALQDRRSGLAGVGALVDRGNMGLGQAAAQAEQQQARNFGVLGQAANMNANEQNRAFQYNQMLPYQKRMSILGAKAQGGAQMLNAGMQNMFSGITTAGELGAFRGSGTSAGYSAPYANPNNIGVANTSGGYSDPASQYSSINPYVGPLIGG